MFFIMIILIVAIHYTHDFFLKKEKLKTKRVQEEIKLEKLKMQRFQEETKVLKVEMEKIRELKGSLYSKEYDEQQQIEDEVLQMISRSSE
ncbi:hypothetical protein [Bacillus sp. Hm123]|uniref:hypothetical protein n=1 Tax=Bacillus sp. Hm123 TaxID=3450745 RepID=UPI003F43CFB1